MKKIVIVVSTFGLGHLTRQIALKDALLDQSSELAITFVISERQERLFREAIHSNDNIIIERIPITPTIVMESWNEVDVESSIESYQRFWEWETQIRDDRAWERILFGADLVINDIECVHNPIAHKMRIPIVNLSNFTWSDIISGLGFEGLATDYRSWESLSDLNLKLPFALECKSFKDSMEVGLLVRKPDEREVEKIKNYTEKPKILINNSHHEHRKYLHDLAHALVQEGFTPILPDWILSQDHVQGCLIIDKEEDAVHNYYAAADLVISKLGYGTVSEILSGGTPIFYWKRAGFKEDDALEQGVLKNGIGQKIRHDITIPDMVEKVKTFDFKKVDPMEPSNETIAKILLDYLNQE